eukprot:scaffold118611_cov32-Phaeocystis_antarctica.AAC.1
MVVVMLSICPEILIEMDIVYLLRRPGGHQVRRPGPLCWSRPALASGRVHRCLTAQDGPRCANGL